jgi:tRNA G18 (ribose-2'-O)-methylase SpoU
VEHVKMRHFHTLDNVRSYLKEKGCTILGVEIMDGARSIAASPYSGPTAFILGNEVRASLLSEGAAL